MQQGVRGSIYFYELQPELTNRLETNYYMVEEEEEDRRMKERKGEKKKKLISIDLHKMHAPARHSVTACSLDLHTFSEADEW